MLLPKGIMRLYWTSECYNDIHFPYSYTATSFSLYTIEVNSLLVCLFSQEGQIEQQSTWVMPDVKKALPSEI